MSTQPERQYEDDLAPEKKEAILNWIEQKTQRFGLTVPAMMFVEANRPLSFIYSQFAHFGAPYIDTLLGGNRVADIAQFMQNPDNIELLISRLEEQARAENEEAKRRREERKKARLAAKEAKRRAREERRNKTT